MGEISAVQPQGVGVSLMWLILGCAAGQGMIFDLSALSVLNETVIYVWEKGFSKARISSHQLMIEISRYNQTTKDNRHCPFCGSNLIELIDEVHFLFRCPTYSMITNSFYNKVKTLIPNITQLPENVLINEPMNSSNYFINIQFIKIYFSLIWSSWQIITKVTSLPSDIILVLKIAFAILHVVLWSWK